MSIDVQYRLSDAECLFVRLDSALFIRTEYWYATHNAGIVGSLFCTVNGFETSAHLVIRQSERLVAGNDCGAGTCRAQVGGPPGVFTTQVGLAWT